MKLRNISLALCLLLSFALSISACGGKSSDANDPAAPPLLNGADADEQLTASQNGLYNVEVNWSPNLEAGTLDNSALLHFHNAAGEHVPAILKRFSLYHATMGHGSIKENEMVFTQEDLGHWLVKNIYFSMPGAARSWVVDIEAELDGKSDKARVVIDAEVR